MSWKKLQLYREIFNSKEFAYISSVENIKKILDIIRLMWKEKNKSENAQKLELYDRNLQIFYGQLKGKCGEYVEKGYATCIEELLRCINILKQSNTVSRGYCRVFEKRFLYGLGLIKKGISFDINLDGGLNIGNEVFARFLLDKIVGLGNKYLFDQRVINRLTRFAQSEKKKILYNLRTTGPQRLHFGNGWEKYGIGRGQRYRMYGSPKHLFSKRRIYFLIRNEPAIKRRQDNYVGRKSPSECVFF